MTVATLFDPVTMSGLRLNNRIVMSPMTRQQAQGGILNPSDYYLKRARGGVGLIISEGIAIDDPVSDYTTLAPHLFGREALAAWARTVAAVTSEGVPMFAQLWHTGMKRPVARSRNPHLPSKSPSGIYPGVEEVFDPMTEQDITEVILSYGRAALAARDAGFAGINIHAAHGYIIDQFFWPQTNRRSDGWGGDVTGRVRLGVEVLREIRRQTGPDFPIMLRFSQWKTDAYEARLADTPSELAALLEPLAEAGVDIFDASTRRYWVPEFDGSDLNLAGWAKKLTGKPSMTVGAVGLEGPLDANLRLKGQAEAVVAPARLDRLNDMLMRGDFDLVGVGRALLANADWANLVREDRFSEMSPYTKDTAAHAVI